MPKVDITVVQKRVIRRRADPKIVQWGIDKVHLYARSPGADLGMARKMERTFKRYLSRCQQPESTDQETTAMPVSIPSG